MYKTNYQTVSARCDKADVETLKRFKVSLSKVIRAAVAAASRKAKREQVKCGGK